MFLQEWPLTFFTILSQMAVGAFIILGFIQVTARRSVARAGDSAEAKAKSQALERVSDAALYAIGPLMVAGFVAAFFHLGNPINGFNVLRGIGNSPLAQEVMMGAGFAVLGFAFAATQWFHWGSPKLRFGLAIITALWGLAFVWSMARLYMLPTIPHWNHWTTPAQFYVTTFLTGALAIGTALAWFPKLRNKAWLNKLMPANRQPADMTPEHVEHVNTLVQRAEGDRRGGRAPAAGGAVRHHLRLQPPGVRQPRGLRVPDRLVRCPPGAADHRRGPDGPVPGAQ